MCIFAHIQNIHYMNNTTYRIHNIKAATMLSVPLQTDQHRNLLDIVDRLRSRGISKYVDLPEIVVCGDQSAGKSSVLEAISGMKFPTKDNLCTRFATELALRHEADVGLKITIIPGPNRSDRERQQLSAVTFDSDITNLDLGSVVEKAKDAMGISDTKRFSSDILRVELSGPSQPHLTMVDLPGLFRAANSEQSLDDSKTVEQMVIGHMKRPRSTILAVVSAKSDFALQEVTEYTRELDPKGVRSLGLITKPDTLDAGSKSEAAYFKLAQNKDVVFRLG
jgi:GTP-binding protein EngB required for normal cell division